MAVVVGLSRPTRLALTLLPTLIILHPTAEIVTNLPEPRMETPNTTDGHGWTDVSSLNNQGAA